MNDFSGANEIVNKLSLLYKELHEVLKDPLFDSISYLKKSHIEQKLAGGDFKKLSTVYLGITLKNARPVASDREYVHLPNDFFRSPDLTPAPNSIFIVTNNDIGSALPQYIDYYNRHPEALFLIWDWDSQHWIYMSSMLAMHSDFYVSGGSENIYLLSHFSSTMLGPVFGAVNQWTRQFILDNMDTVLMDRRDEPFGPHVFYPSYPRRNRAIATVNKVYPTVRFAGNEYKDRSDLDNLREWCSYKTHYIIPVLGGAPIRAFNAMLTGGIPILPAYLRNFPEIDIMGDLPVYYDVGDLIDPRTVHEAGVRVFDSFDKKGLEERVLQALEDYHIDGRCEYLLNLVENEAVKILSADKSHREGYFTLSPKWTGKGSAQPDCGIQEGEGQ